MTHLSMNCFRSYVSLAALLSGALPQLRCLHVQSSGLAALPDISDLVLQSAFLVHLVLKASTEPRHTWVRDLLRACALAGAKVRPQGALKVELLEMEAEALQAAKQLWAQLVASVAAPASVVVVTDFFGADLLTV